MTETDRRGNWSIEGAAEGVATVETWPWASKTPARADKEERETQERRGMKTMCCFKSRQVFVTVKFANVNCLHICVLDDSCGCVADHASADINGGPTHSFHSPSEDCAGWVTGERPSTHFCRAC